MAHYAQFGQSPTVKVTMLLEFPNGDTKLISIPQATYFDFSADQDDFNTADIGFYDQSKMSLSNYYKKSSYKYNISFEVSPSVPMTIVDNPVNP